MLSLDDRTLFLEAIKPPVDYDVDFVVGTTFSLDVVVALQIPLAFTQHQYQREDARQLLSLDAMKRFTDRILIFCQSGRISSPRNYPLLFSYMEDTVFEVVLEDNGSFHPKVWAIRYQPNNPSMPVKYRLLCLSRNLTDDRSWDTALVLEGELSEHRTLGYGDQRQISDFFDLIPQLTKSDDDIPESKLRFVEVLTDEIHRVKFNAPSGLEIKGFHPIIPTSRQQQFPFNPNQRIRRGLIVSPFVTSYFVSNVLKVDTQSTLVTRLEEAQKGGASLWNHFHLDENGTFSNLYVITPDAVPTDDGEELGEFGGLHAKLFMFDMVDGSTHIFTGSANATSAAFKKNVEFMVELKGNTKQFGTQKLLTEDAKTDTLYQLIKPFHPTDEYEERDEDRAERILEDVRNLVVQAKMNATIQSSKTNPDLFDVNITSTTFNVSDIASIFVRPATIDQSAKLFIDNVKFSSQSILYLTAFYEFRLVVQLEGKEFEKQFILKLPVTGMPEDRDKHIVRSYLDTPEKFMRFMLMILADESDVDDLILLLEHEKSANGNGTSGSTFAATIPLYETMVKSLYRNPHRLDDINRIIEDLRSEDADNSILPPDFDAIWEPLYQARLNLDSE